MVNGTGSGCVQWWALKTGMLNLRDILRGKLIKAQRNSQVGTQTVVREEVQRVLVEEVTKPVSCSGSPGFDFRSEGPLI